MLKARGGPVPNSNGCIANVLFRFLKLAAVAAIAVFCVTLSTDKASAAAGCYKIANNTSDSPITLYISWTGGVVPMPTDGSSTPLSVPLFKNGPGYQMCFNSGTSATVYVDYWMFAVSKTGSILIGDAAGAVAAQSLNIVDDPAPKKVKPKPAPDPFKGFVDPNIPYVLFQFDDLRAGDCTLTRPKAMLRADGQFMFATSLMSHTMSGDVWHAHLALQRADGRNVDIGEGHYDSPKFCEGCAIGANFLGKKPDTTPVAWTIRKKVDLELFPVPVQTSPPGLTAQRLSEMADDSLVPLSQAKQAGEPSPIICPPLNKAAQDAYEAKYPASSRACVYAYFICAKQKSGEINYEAMACGVLEPGYLGVPTFGSFFDSDITAKYGWPPNQDSRLWYEATAGKLKLVFDQSSC